LGCGTGSISKKIKEHFPDAKITCVDFAENMLKMAKNKLRNFKNIAFVASDVMKFDFTGFDAVVTSLTLHHIRKAARKRALYKRVFQGLNKNGAFFIADLTLGSTDHLQGLNLEKWEEFLLKSFPREGIPELKKRYEKEDHPFKLIDELAWLKAGGFKNVDVVWKHYHFAVYGGIK
jgi:tRNA (cmo5U34)-methyltransferase